MKKEISSNLIRDIIFLKRKGMKISEISKKYNLNDRTILRYTKGIVHPNKNLFVLDEKFKKFSDLKAEILGFLSAEGCEVKYTTNYQYKDKRRPKAYIYTSSFHRIIFTNKDPYLINRFIFLMKKVYNYNAKVRSNGNIEINVKDIRDDLLKYSNFGSRRWSVPKIVFDGNLNIKKSWIRAYGDGDGSVEIPRKRIFFKSVNLKGLKQVQILLKSLDINSYIRGPYANAYILITKEIKKYAKIIGFIHKKRLEKLNFLTKKI